MFPELSTVTPEGFCMKADRAEPPSHTPPPAIVIMSPGAARAPKGRRANTNSKQNANRPEILKFFKFFNRAIALPPERNLHGCHG